MITLVSDTDEDSCEAFNGSQRSLPAAVRDKSTPTPTHDLLSSITTTDQVIFNVT